MAKSNVTPLTSTPDNPGNPLVLQAPDQVINVPSIRQAVAAQILDTAGNVIGIKERPLYITSSAWRQRLEEEAAAKAKIGPVAASTSEPSEEQVKVTWGHLHPILYTTQNQPQQRWGLDAEAIQQDTRLTVDGQYDMAGVLAVLVAEVNRQKEFINNLVQRIEELQTRK